MIGAIYALAIIRLCWSIRYVDIVEESEDAEIGEKPSGDLLSPSEVKGACQDYLPRTSLFHDGSEKRVSEPTVALYAVFVNTSDHYKSEDLVKDGLAMFQSSRKHKSNLAMNLIVANVAEEAKKQFTDIGVNVQDLTHAIPEVKSWYFPIYNEGQAKEHERPWVHKNIVQARNDGWACYFKYFVWKAPYDAVLIADLDFEFERNLDSLVTEAAKQGRSFLTCHETKHRDYNGFNTHVAILRPSSTTFQQLVKKSSIGDYVPVTNTEQDILECFFPVPHALFQEGFEDLCQPGHWGTR